MALNMILNKLNDCDYSIHEYKEHDKLCGYEMETWTDNGVNMVHFIDCRDYTDGVTAANVMDQLRQILSCFDVDEEIHTLMEDKSARNVFSYRQAVHDMEAYEQHLKETVWAVQTKFDNSNEAAARALKIKKVLAVQHDVSVSSIVWTGGNNFIVVKDDKEIRVQFK